MTDALTHTGGCHCGAIKFKFSAPEILDVTDCDCFICKMSAYQHVFVPQPRLTFIAGKDDLIVYTFNTGAAQHLFCKTCGIKPLYIPRSHPDCYSVNLRCIVPGTFTIGKTIPFSGSNWEENIGKLKSET